MLFEEVTTLTIVQTGVDPPSPCKTVVLALQEDTARPGYLLASTPSALYSISASGNRSDQTLIAGQSSALGKTTL